MQFSILNRFSAAVQFTAEIDCAEDAAFPVKLGMAVKWAVSNEADLNGANLNGANLYGAEAIMAGIDSRGYEFYLTAGPAPNDIVVRAGCRRWVTFAEARAHFTQGYASNGSVPEIMAKLDYLETVAKARGYIS